MQFPANDMILGRDMSDIPLTKETDNCPFTNTALSFDADRPDAMTVSPLWVNESPEGIQGGSRDPSLLPPVYN